LFVFLSSVFDTSGKVHRRSSQLSKTLEQVLRDQDALAYFISYLQSLHADNFVRFWLDVEAFRLAAKRTPPTENAPPLKPTPRSADETDSLRLAATDQTQPTSACQPIGDAVVSELRACSTPEVTQPRIPTNYCGHASSSSAGNSPKTGGRLPAHGEVVISTDSAVPSGAGAPHQSSRPTVDCCPASNPSMTTATSASTQLLGPAKPEVQSPGFSGTTTSESPLKAVERDATAIFTKYLSLDCPCPVTVSDELRVATVRRICHDDGVPADCFGTCQAAVFQTLDRDYFPGFRRSIYHSKHQIDILTGSHVRLSDVLYDDTAFSYFTEFMEAECATAVLQCFLDLDNFRQLLEHATFDCSSTAQDDAIVIYDKYFSLQASANFASSRGIDPQ